MLNNETLTSFRIEQVIIFHSLCVNPKFDIEEKNP